MKKTLLITLFTILNLSSFAQIKTWQWGQRGGSATTSTQGYGPDEDIDDITTDKWGNVYVIGTVFSNMINIAGYQFPFVGTAQLDQTYIASFKCDGSLRWAKMMYGCQGKPRAIKADSTGEVFITGYITITAGNGHCEIRNATTIDTTIAQWPNPISRSWYLMKLDTGGAYNWIRFPQADTATISGGSAGAMDMDIDEAGNCYIMAELNNGAYANGAFVVNHTGGWGADHNQELYMVKYDHNGNFVNGYQLPFAFAGQGAPDERLIRDNKRHRNIISGIDGFYAGDSLAIDGHHIRTMFIAAFDDTGYLLWLTQQDSAGQAGLIGACDNRATLDKDGNAYLSGGCQNGYSFGGSVATNTLTQGSSIGMVYKLDTAGHILWAQHSNNSSTVGAAQVALSDDTVGVFGTYSTALMAWDNDTLHRPANCGNSRPYLARLNAHTGAVIAVDSIQGPCGSNVSASQGGGYIDGGTGVIAADRFGNFYMGGYFDLVAWIGNDTLVSVGGTHDWYVCKFGTTNCTQPVGIDTVTAVQELNTAITELNVYPNPSAGQFTFSADAALGQLNIYNLVGEKIYTATTGNKQLTIDLGRQASGVYIYTLHTCQGNVMKGKLLIE